MATTNQFLKNRKIRISVFVIGIIIMFAFHEPCIGAGVCASSGFINA